MRCQCFSVIYSAAQSGCIWQSSQDALKPRTWIFAVIPDTLKIILVIGTIAGAAYGAVWGLATFPPEQAEVVKALPHDKIRQN